VKKSDLLNETSRRFRPGEMMILAGAAMGRKLSAATLVDQVREDLARNPFFKMTAQRYGINQLHFISKLESTRLELREVIVKRLGDWCCLKTGEMMAANGLPSIASLQRVGLVIPKIGGDPAWGFFCVRTMTQTSEFLLRDVVQAVAVEETDLGTLASNLVMLVDAPQSRSNTDLVFKAIYRIVACTGWRRCLVLADDGIAKVSEISVEAFLNDLYSDSLNGVLLAGVNAPDYEQVA
jgi:hypothetical protein